MDRPRSKLGWLWKEAAAWESAASPLHGKAHWENVFRNARAMCDYAKYGERAYSFSELFAIFHDSQRKTDFSEPLHGPLAAESAAHYGFEDIQLRYALAFHDRGWRTSDPIVGIVWDADRLELRRLDIEINPKLMNTKYWRKALKEFYHG